jgi:hypothetical protein
MKSAKTKPHLVFLNQVRVREIDYQMAVFALHCRTEEDEIHVLQLHVQMGKESSAIMVQTLFSKAAWFYTPVVVEYCERVPVL